jgi:hypothetical protein
LKSSTLLATGGPWLKKYTEIYTVRPAWLKIMQKSDKIFSDRPPWLRSILKSGTLFSHRRFVVEKYAEIYTVSQTAVAKNNVEI